MTTAFYTTKNYQTDHSAFGGEIESDDFNTASPNKKRISNLADAFSMKKALEREQKMREKYKNMTLEELREMKLISNTNGRPSSTLTDEKWQKEFKLRKMFVTPYGKDIKKLGGKYSRESGMWNKETTGEFYGQTNWQSYCSFINDILSNIRHGQEDYCYYIYQIMDLLKFHYDTLKTEYCDGYWKVWLEDNKQEY